MGWFCIVVAYHFLFFVCLFVCLFLSFCLLFFVFCVFFLLWLFLGRWLTSWNHTGQENCSYTRLDNWKQGDGTEQKCAWVQMKKGRFGSFSDRTGYNNKIFFWFVYFLFVCLFVFYFVLFCFLLGGVIIHSIENVHSCGWNSSYLLGWPSIVPEKV